MILPLPTRSPNPNSHRKEREKSNLSLFTRSEAQSHDPMHVYVNPHWPRSDGCLELLGYDVKACPLSAIVGLTCYYAICGEAMR
ncbi:MAG: hypothetical protein ACLQNE_16465 [Thermoguttaceae bacterium]